MAIQGTQVLMYTKHTLFLYFSDFSILFLFLYEKKNKQHRKKKQKKKKQNKKKNKKTTTITTC